MTQISNGAKPISGGNVGDRKIGQLLDRTDVPCESGEPKLFDSEELTRPMWENIIAALHVTASLDAGIAVRESRDVSARRQSGISSLHPFVARMEFLLDPEPDDEEESGYLIRITDDDFEEAEWWLEKYGDGDE